MSNIQRPVQVLVGWGGKNLFEVSGDKRVAVHTLSSPDAPAPDIVVIPAAKTKGNHLLSADAIPAETWARARAGQTLVVFDASTDGNVHTAEASEGLHSYLAQVGVPARFAVYVTQDRTYGAAYTAWRQKAGLGEGMAVLNYDFFINRFFNAFDGKGTKIFERRLAAFRARPAERSRRFVCLNLTPRPSKVFLLLKMIRDGLWDQGYISFGGVANIRGPWRLERENGLRGHLAALPGFEDLARELDPYVEQLEAKGVIFIGDPARAKYNNLDFHTSEYDNSWFTVVTETEMTGPRRITEKPLKSMVNFHPTIMLGNPGSLDLLRELGFRTFQGYFDESYDREPDPRRRFDMVYEEIRRICALDDERLRKLEKWHRDVLIHNAEHGLVRLPHIYRDQIDVQFMDELVSLLGWETHRSPALV